MGESIGATLRREPEVACMPEVTSIIHGINNDKYKVRLSRCHAAIQPTHKYLISQQPFSRLLVRSRLPSEFVFFSFLRKIIVHKVNKATPVFSERYRKGR